MLYTARDSKSGEFVKIDASDLKPSKQGIFGDNMADAEGFKDEDVDEGKNPLFELRAVKYAIHVILAFFCISLISRKIINFGL